MEKLRALHSYGYGTRALQPGDEFEADENDAALIVEMGQAERVKPAEPKPETDTQQSSADTSHEPAQPPEPKKKRAKRGGYLRRDERAQD